MIFEPYKAVDIPINRKRISNRNDSLDHFWEKVNKMEDDLSESAGCYIFSIRAGGGSRPWYVGLAAKQTFRKECFTNHKVVIYNEVLHDRKRGIPTLTLISKKTKKGRLAKPSKNGQRDIEFLEDMLIGNCIIRNPDLYNIKDTKLLKEMIVPGLLNSKGRLNPAAKEFKKLIGE